MKKTAKHRFTHIDPENINNYDSAKKPIDGLKKQALMDPSLRIIQNDLLRVIRTIVPFIILLLIFYYFNQKLNFFSQFTKLFSL